MITNTTSELDKLVYTPVQVAKILQVSKHTVYGLIERGEIFARKLGRVYRIPRETIVTLVRESRKQSTIQDRPQFVEDYNKILVATAGSWGAKSESESSFTKTLAEAEKSSVAKNQAAQW